MGNIVDSTVVEKGGYLFLIQTMGITGSYSWRAFDGSRWISRGTASRLFEYSLDAIRAGTEAMEKRALVMRLRDLRLKKLERFKLMLERCEDSPEYRLSYLVQKGKEIRAEDLGVRIPPSRIDSFKRRLLCD